MSNEIVSEDENKKVFKHDYEIESSFSNTILGENKFSFQASYIFIDGDEDENEKTKKDKKEIREFAECVLAGEDTYLDLNFNLVEAIDSIIELSASDSKEFSGNDSGFVVTSKDRAFFKGLRGLLLSQACRLEHLTFDDEL